MAITCPHCQYASNQNTAVTCVQCGVSLPSQSQQGNAVPPSSGGNSGQSSAAISTSLLTGRITWIERSTENIDFNLSKFLSQLILFLVFLPLLVVIFFISFALWVSLSILGFSALSRDISPFNIANSINSIGVLMAIVFPRVSESNQIPAVTLTIQTPEGERPAIIKGELVSGTFRTGDDIELQGEWNNGTLIVRSGFNNTLNTSIILRRCYWGYILILLLGMVVSIGMFLLESYS